MEESPSLGPEGQPRSEGSDVPWQPWRGEPRALVASCCPLPAEPEQAFGHLRPVPWELPLPLPSSSAPVLLSGEVALLRAH